MSVSDSSLRFKQDNALPCNRPLEYGGSYLSKKSGAVQKLLGRPKGALGKSRLDGKEQDIRVLLGKNVSRASIAKILDVSRSALYHFIETRKIVPS